MAPMLLIPEIRARLRRGRTALYDDVAAGMLPPFIRLGARRVALPQTEVDAVLNARVAGLSDDDIRALVQRLVADRQKLLPAAVAAQ